MEVTSNEPLRNALHLLDTIKEQTGASYVRIFTAPFDGLTVQINWDDDCHTRKHFTDAELLQANFDITNIIIEYSRLAHKMLLEGKLWNP